MFVTSLEAIFETEVITHEEELFARLSKVEKRRKDHADIVSSIEEVKVVAMANVEHVVHHMETLCKELVEAEAEFNELKRK